MSIESSEILAVLNELLEHSSNLRNALIKRDVAAIQTLSGTVEETLNKLQHMEKRSSPATPAGNANRNNHQELRKNIGALVSRIQTIQRTNKAMASAFLTIINKTFAALCSGGNGTAGTYGATGNRDLHISSILVQQQG
ncbi:MAG: hypothetical protein A2283_02270 [Lentisphaerae bacterium RIFOXYA12_FULL_48_11]|nr:MAG: hypothetical protein A2283_02270 [Lentisphaerae bacterium RIFOXYA12_FULL_48_11]